MLSRACTAEQLPTKDTLTDVTKTFMRLSWSNIGNKSWPINPAYDHQGRSIGRGSIELSPSFLTQNGVSFRFLRNLLSAFCSLLMLFAFTQSMHTSRGMLGENMREHTFEWIQRSLIPQTLLNALLMLIHPDQYTQCVLARQFVMNDPQLIRHDARISEWPSVLPGAGITVNECQVAHTNDKVHPAGFNLMTSLGNSEEATMEFPDWNASLAHRPGTVIAATLRIVAHQVGYWGNGDQICMSQWMEALDAPDMPGVTSWANRRGTVLTMRALARNTGSSLPNKDHVR
jgi:hypothetical protein